MNKKLLWTIVKYGLGLLVLGWVVWSNWEPSNGSPGLKQALQREIHIVPLIAALLVSGVALSLTFVRWYYLVRAVELPFTMKDAMRLGMVGFALSTFLPGSVGGDIVKAAFLAREQSRRTVAVATVIIDRILGLFGLFWLAAILGAVFWLTGEANHPVLKSIIVGAWIICGLGVVFWIVFGLLSHARSERLANRFAAVPKVGGPVAEMWRAVWMYRCRGRVVGLALMLAIVGHVGFVLVFYLAALSLFPAVELPSLKAHFLIVPVSKVIEAGVPLPGGIGAGEFSYEQLYQLIGFAAACGVLASLFQRVILWTWALIGYLAYLRMRPSLEVTQAKQSIQTDEPEELELSAATSD